MSSLPTCTGDAHCVALCRVRDDLSWQCYDNTGAVMTGMTQGVGMTYVASGAHAADGGYVQAMNYIDDTSSADAIPRINNAAIRAAFGGNHTIITSGWASTVVNANGGWWAMITDATNFMQIRAGGGELQFLETGMAGAEATSSRCLLGWCVVALRRTGGTLLGRSGGVNSSGTAGVTTAAITGTNALYFGGGTGGCCTPGGAIGGPMAWLAIYDEAKTDAWVAQAEKDWYGASAVMSGALNSIGTNVGQIMGRDDITDAGTVNFFGTGSYMTDPTLGIRTFTATQNFAAADPLAAGTWTDVGTPVVTSNATAGPFFKWKNTKEGDLITTSNAAALDGKRSLAVVTSSDGGFTETSSGSGWVNCSAVLSQGTSGVTRTKAQFKFITDGSLDAGALTCNVTGLDSTARRYPLNDGCSAYIVGAKSVKCDLLVGNATPEVGSITAYQWQVTQSQFPEWFILNGTASGAAYPELDGGALPSGANKGKIEVVFSILYNTVAAAPDYLRGGASASYILDGYGPTASHDVLLDFSGLANPDGGALGVPSMQALMYGPSETYENRFDVGPIQLAAQTLYVWSYEWRPATGVLPDAGFGVGCRGKARLDLCSDPTSCHATTVVGSNSPPIPSFPLGAFNINTGNLGTCPDVTTTIDLGTRLQGTNPTSVWVRDVRIYQ